MEFEFCTERALASVVPYLLGQVFSDEVNAVRPKVESGQDSYNFCTRAESVLRAVLYSGFVKKFREKAVVSRPCHVKIFLSFRPTAVAYRDTAFSSSEKMENKGFDREKCSHMIGQNYSANVNNTC